MKFRVDGFRDYATLPLESQNSKWRTQYGNLAYDISVNSEFFPVLA